MKKDIIPNTKTLAEEVEAFEQDRIERALMDHDGNLTRAALQLRVKRTTLVMKIKKYGTKLFTTNKGST